jgi:hypothetical protein
VEFGLATWYGPDGIRSFMATNKGPSIGGRDTMKGTLRTWARLGVVALIALVAGCVKEDVRGDTSVFSYEGWVSGLVIVGGLVATPLGFAIRKKIPRLGWVLLIGGPILIVAVAPGMFLDKTVVDRDHFEASYGMWFAPSQVDVKFDELASMHLSAETKGFGRRRRTERNMDLTYKSGKTRRVPLGDMLRYVAPRIAQRAEEKGVAVTGGLDTE